MDSTKRIIHSNSENIKMQLNTLTEMLQKIAELDSTCVAIVANSSTQELNCNTKSLQHVNSLQCEILRKFNSITIDLECLCEQKKIIAAPVNDPIQPAIGAVLDHDRKQLQFDIPKEREVKEAAIVSHEDAKTSEKHEVVNAEESIPCKVKICSRVVSSVSECNGDATDKAVTYNKAFHELVLPSFAEEVIIRIVHVSSVCRFYAHIISSSQITVSEYGAFETLYDYMNFSQMVKNYEQLKSLPQCGEIVIAKYSDDQWYRAQVKSIKLQETAVSSANIKVLLVEVIDLKLKDLRKITDTFLTIPFQAVNCHLFTAIENKEMSQEEAKHFFEESYLYKDFNAKVIRVNSDCIELLMYDRDGKDVARTLIERKWALPNLDVYAADNMLTVVD